jgi:hypothetical protein
MGAAVLQLPVTFETTGACPECGIDLAVPSNFLRVKREQGGDLFCPNGHKFHYTKTEVQKLQEELEAEKRRTQLEREAKERERARAETMQRSNAALRGQVTKIKHRVGNGVCPCCRRTFQNLMRHMKTKHPTYKDEGAKE